MIRLDDKLQYLKGVGEKRAIQFKRLGAETVADLLAIYPRAYEDWSRLTKIANAVPGENCCIKAFVVNPVKKGEIRKGLTIFKCDVHDGENLMTITIFNNRFAAAKLKEGDEYLFFGRVTNDSFRREMINPQIERPGTGERIRPIYPQTSGLSTYFIERCVKRALEELEGFPADILDEDVRRANGLIGTEEAVRNIHFPSDHEAAAKARKRLCFDELYVLQTGMMLIKHRNRSLSSCVIKDDRTEEFIRGLPFRLTNAQLRAVKEGIADLAGSRPMSRLLQGDVGSGKTVVAAALCHTAAKNGFQCAVMAPTEILAQQHFKTFRSLLKGTGIHVGLITGSTPAAEKTRIKAELASGECDVCIGTHALIQNDVVFKDLGLVITDEQHRFGVKQRSALIEKGSKPHTLVMSATPIPRTLALMIYGDLDVSVLDELPAGRKRIKTYAIDSTVKARAYGYVKKHLNEGRQAYVVCPLVEEGEIPGLTAAEAFAEELSAKVFRGYTVGLLHGKMKAKEKEAVMAAFVAGNVQILVATTVIEVGIDVPNAVIMVIENAERFGLSQLHQLRGRIGRGEHQSTCILISDDKSQTAQHRLRTMCSTSDGFRIAEEDLKLRGPGDFFGKRQHGLPEMKIADLTTDIELLRSAQEAARALIEDDPKLKKEQNSKIKKAVIKLFEAVGPGGMN